MILCRGPSLCLPLYRAGIFAGALLVAISSATAQQVEVVVNGDAITSMDIAHRSKLIQLTTRKVPPRQEVINELVDDKLKILFAKRYRLEATDSDVEAAFSDMAQRMRTTGDGLTKVLTAQGVAPYTLKDRLRAEIVWTQVIRGKFQASFQVTEKEVASTLESRKKDEKDNSGFSYTLRPILFIVARNSGDGATEARKKDAGALKSRFESCETGIPFARSLRDTIVRAPVTKTSAELAPALREILDKTPVGRLTDPEVTSQGVEIFALCERKETSLDDATKKKIQNEKFTELFQANSAKLLKTLRAGAMIEYKHQREDSDAKRSGRNAR
jgi:peptidyl-prolyl cis-trans isomerase SurA